MKRILSVGLGLFYLIVLPVAFVGGFSLASHPVMQLLLPDPRVPLPPLAEAWVLLDQQFYGEVPPADVRLRGVIRGVLETLEDPYTVLLEPPAAAQEQHQLSGRFGGIGAELWWSPDGDGSIGISPYPGSPAEIAGVREGDRLLSVGGNAVTDTLSLDAISQQLYGEVGTTVELAILRPPTLILTLTIERAEVLRPSIRWRWLDGDRTTGYLKITSITDETATEVRDVLDGDTLKSLQALVIDLRGNGGGVTAPLPDLTGAFLRQGNTLYIEMSHSGEVAIKASGQTLYAEPLVVLVDGGTASAAEILAAALQENGRATLIGEPTFGKGSIQALYPLSDGSTLHITNAVWLTPQRHRLDHTGIQPDLLVSPVAERDAVLEAALELLGSQSP